MLRNGGRVSPEWVAGIGPESWPEWSGKRTRETDELIFLPHAAYMCAGCLEDIQTVRDKHG